MTGHKLRLSKKEVAVKDGKLVRVRPFMARKKENDAARLAKRWEAKKKPPAGAEGVD